LALRFSFALWLHRREDIADVNASLLAPARYRCIPGIAYRLALVAAGEGDVGISVNGPTGWDIAGGHALLLGAGGDVFDKAGKRITYDRLGTPHNRDTSRCFGDGGTFSTLAGQPTDDSELALALARSIVRKGVYDREDAASSYAQWLASGPFDVGTTTSTALSAANQTSGLPGVKRPRPATLWPVDVLNLAENLLLAGYEAK
jgi:hypothetical protein